MGARVSIAVAAIATVSGMLLGVSVGIISGYYGGLIDEGIQRVVEVWLAIPFILFALVIIILFGASIEIMLILMVLLAWSAFVRNIRAEVLILKELDYIASAQISGASDLRIMWRHLAPGVFNTALVIATLRVGQLILAEASLSFLGAGIPDPTPAWGVMVADGRDFLATAWWVSFFPGVAIFLTVMSFNFMGDWLRDRLDPRLRQLS
jgi:peptide/nickel transport system permease protein